MLTSLCTPRLNLKAFRHGIRTAVAGFNLRFSFFCLVSSRRELNKELTPDKERANELRREFEKGFNGIARRIWPNLTHVHGVVTGTYIHTYIHTYLIDRSP